MTVRSPFLFAAVTGALVLQLLTVSPAVGHDIPSKGSFASSVADGSSAAAAVDGDIFTHYASAPHDSPNAKEWIAVDLGGVQHDLNRVRIYPREGRYGFPERAAIQYSVDGEQWRDAPTDGAVRRPARWEQVVIDFEPVTARYVRLLATQLGRDDTGAYSLQVAELSGQHHDAQRPDRTATVIDASASSEHADHPPAAAVDGSGRTYWGSRPAADQTANTQLTVQFEKRHDITALVLTPAADGVGFPADFRLQYSPRRAEFCRHSRPGARGRCGLRRATALHLRARTRACRPRRRDLVAGGARWLRCPAGRSVGRGRRAVPNRPARRFRPSLE